MRLDSYSSKYDCPLGAYIDQHYCEGTIQPDDEVITDLIDAIVGVS